MQMRLALKLPADIAPGETLQVTAVVENGGIASVAGATLVLVAPVHVGSDDSGWATALATLEPGARYATARSVNVPAQAAAQALVFGLLLVYADGRVQQSEPQTTLVRARPLLAGPASSTRIDLGACAGEVTIGATIVNAGTTAACDVVVALPPPPGTAAVDSALTVRHWPLVAPGEARTFWYRARIVTGVLSSLVVSGATVAEGGRPAAALPPSAALELRPALGAPSVRARRGRHGLHVRVSGENVGPGTAAGLAVRLTWPPGLRCGAGSVRWNGARVLDAADTHAYARARHDDGRIEVIAATLDAGERYELQLRLDATADRPSGSLCVEVGDGPGAARTQIPVVWSRPADIRLQLREFPHACVDSGIMAFAFDAVNAGDTEVELHLRSMDASVDLSTGGVLLGGGALTISAGRIQRIEARALLAASGAVAPCAIIIEAAAGAALRARLAVPCAGVAAQRPKAAALAVGTGLNGDVALCGGHQPAVPALPAIPDQALLASLHEALARDASPSWLRHLRAMAALAARTGGGRADSDAALTAAAQATRALVERLQLVLRLPGYAPVLRDVTTGDLTAAIASAMIRLDAAPPARGRSTPSGDAAGLLETIEGPLETPNVAANMAEFVTRLGQVYPDAFTGPGDFTVALASYVDALSAFWAEARPDLDLDRMWPGTHGAACDRLADSLLAACRAALGARAVAPACTPADIPSQARSVMLTQ